MERGTSKSKKIDIINHNARLSKEKIEQMVNEAQAYTNDKIDQEEVAEGGYDTLPPLKTVASTTSVVNFVVVRNGFGSISFKEPVDLTGVSSLSALREIVSIEKGRVTVYPDESKNPGVGSGLNVPAEVLLEKLFPPPYVDAEKQVVILKSKRDREFVSYDSDTGAYVFKVSCFSTYTVGDYLMYRSNSGSSSSSTIGVSRSISPVEFNHSQRRSVGMSMTGQTGRVTRSSGPSVPNPMAATSPPAAPQMARLEPYDPRPTVSLETKRLFKSLMTRRIAGTEIPDDVVEALGKLKLECAAFNRMVDESISQTGHVSAYRKVYLRNGKIIVEELPTGTHEKLIRRMDKYIDHQCLDAFEFTGSTSMFANLQPLI
jgi:Nucleoporin autopeptidase